MKKSKLVKIIAIFCLVFIILSGAVYANPVQEIISDLGNTIGRLVETFFNIPLLDRFIIVKPARLVIN